MGTFVTLHPGRYDIIIKTFRTTVTGEVVIVSEKTEFFKGCFREVIRIRNENQEGDEVTPCQ